MYIYIYIYMYIHTLCIDIIEAVINSRAKNPQTKDLRVYMFIIIVYISLSLSLTLSLYIYIYIYRYMYIYIYTYIHTYIHIYTQTFGKVHANLEIPSLKVKHMLESNLLKSRFFARRLDAVQKIRGNEDVINT